MTSLLETLELPELVRRKKNLLRQLELVEREIQLRTEEETIDFLQDNNLDNNNQKEETIDFLQDNNSDNNSQKEKIIDNTLNEPPKPIKTVVIKVKIKKNV